MSAAVCRRRYCGAVLELFTDGSGRVAERCPACTRNRAGICRDCPGRLTDPKQLRCPPCSRARRKAKHDRYDQERYERERAQRLARQKAYYQRKRDELLAKLRARRAREARDEYDRLYAREHARQRRMNMTPAQRRREQRKKAAYYRRNRERILARERARRRTDEARRQAREYQRELRALRKRLRTLAPGQCVVCDAEIPYQGRGPRRIYCEAHRKEKYHRYRARRRQRLEQAVGQEQQLQERAA